MVAAAAVWGLSSGWPDIVVAAIMAGLFVNSSMQILRRAWAERGTAAGAPGAGHAHAHDHVNDHGHGQAGHRHHA